MAEEKIPAVSVIIPMYNTEKYITECLNSLLNQTLENIEVIVVDDCSTDNSLAVAETFIPAFESKNKKLLTITLTQNSGCPGIPRNIALDYATGKYIYFLDSDDFLSEDALEIFYNAAEEFNADVVDAQMTLEYKKVDDKYETVANIMKNTARINQPMLETFDIAQRIDDVMNLKYLNTVWSKFFRRDFLIDNNIKFPAMTITEDLVFTFQYIVLAKNYLRIPFIGYFYRNYHGSTSHISHDIRISSLDLIEGIHCLDSFMKGQKFFIENPKYQYLIIDFFNQKFSDVIFNDIFFGMNLDAEEFYALFSKEIFTLNPDKNIPLSAYLFVSTNIYKMLANQQAAEINRLKKILKDSK